MRSVTMTLFLRGAVLVLAGAGIALASSPPVVSNVTASQRTDGSRKVDISYDLAAGNACTVSVLASSDGGATWSVPVKTFGSGSAVGPGVTPGTNKLIVWDCGADLPGQVGSFKVRVLADDGLGQLPPGGGMVLIPAGEFMMGDTFNEGWSAERPVHAVYVDAFYMDRYEVTKELWDTVRAWGLSNGYTDLIAGGGKGANHPVHSVNWFDCVKWANARSEMEGRTPCYYTNVGLTTVYRTGELAPHVKWNANGYRLPTEAEWEKAARGGASGWRFPWGANINHDHANYPANGSAYTYDTSPYTTWTPHPTFAVGTQPYTNPVGYFAPNGYGLYDMAGNQWEWCNDWYSSTYYSSSPYSNPRGPTSGTYRVIRGSSWNNRASRCRVASRTYLVDPDLRYLSRGFRCAAGTGGN